MFRILAFWTWGNFTPAPVVSGSGGMMMMHAGYLRNRQYRQQESVKIG